MNTEEAGRVIAALSHCSSIAGTGWESLFDAGGQLIAAGIDEPGWSPRQKQWTMRAKFLIAIRSLS